MVTSYIQSITVCLAIGSSKTWNLSLPPINGFNMKFDLHIQKTMFIW